MPEAADAPPSDVLPQLFYDDVVAAKEWLCRTFGFSEGWRLDGPDGVLLMASLNCPSGGSLMVSGLPVITEQVRTAFGDRFRAGTASWPNLTYSITVLVPDVDAHFATATAQGARVLSEPTDQPWGLRDYEVIDLEGRQWNFSQRLRDAQPEEWGAT